MSRNPHFQNLVCKDKYRRLKPSLSESDRQELKADIMKNGCREPIMAWKHMILDGYKRYDICRELGIRCRTKSINFRIEEEAISWICRRELKRSNLSEGYQKYYIGKLYQAQKIVFATLYPTQNQSTPPSQKRPTLEHYDGSRSYTSTLLSAELNLGHSTIYKYGIFAEDIEKIMAKAPEIANIILSDRIHVSHNAVSALASMSATELEKMKICFADKGTFRIQLSDIENALNMKRLFPRPVVKSIEPEIKQVPKYDPDAEISSLTLTIPSWVSSIHRTCSNAPFDNISDGAKYKLRCQLFELKNAIFTIEKTMEGYGND